MEAALRVIWAVIWPPAAPLHDNGSGADLKWWLVICVLTVIPVTAILHNGLFYRPGCMLNPWGRDLDYTLSGTWKWLSRDPSLPWAIIAMVATYKIGKRLSWVKVVVAPVFSSFLPLSLWIWDVPLSGRFICHHFHDKHIMLTSGLPLTSICLYVFGTVVYLSFLAAVVRKMKKAQSAPQ